MPCYDGPPAKHKTQGVTNLQCCIVSLSHCHTHPLFSCSLSIHVLLPVSFTHAAGRSHKSHTGTHTHVQCAHTFSSVHRHALPPTCSPHANVCVRTLSPLHRCLLSVHALLPACSPLAIIWWWLGPRMQSACVHAHTHTHTTHMVSCTGAVCARAADKVGSTYSYLAIAYATYWSRVTTGEVYRPGDDAILRCDLAWCDVIWSDLI